MRGADFEIKDKTPSMIRGFVCVPRYKEIQTYLEDCEEKPTHFVIFDDIENMEPLKDHFVLTDYYGEGLTQNCVSKAKFILTA